MTPEQVLQKFPCFKIPDGMELIEWGKNECPKDCYLVAFTDREGNLAPLVLNRTMYFSLDHYFLLRPKQK